MLRMIQGVPIILLMLPGSVQPDSRSSELSNLTNTGNISGVSNVGGLVGYMDGGKLSNDEENRIQYKGSYNLGKITGIDNVPNNYSSNIGGLVGKSRKCDSWWHEEYAD